MEPKCYECGKVIPDWEDEAVWIDPSTGEATTGDRGEPFHVECAPPEGDPDLIAFDEGVRMAESGRKPITIHITESEQRVLDGNRQVWVHQSVPAEFLVLYAFVVYAIGRFLVAYVISHIRRRK